MKKGGYYSLLPKFPVGNEGFTFYHLRKSDKGAGIGLYNIKLISHFGILLAFLSRFLLDSLYMYIFSWLRHSKFTSGLSPGSQIFGGR